MGAIDGVIITGRATHPSCLLILDDQVEIRVATPMWGKRIWETDAWMKEQAGDDHLVSCTCGRDWLDDKIHLWRKP